MRVPLALAALWSLVTALPERPERADRGWTVAKPGGVENIVITKYNTLNGTSKSSESDPFRVSKTKPLVAGSLPIEVVNNYGEGVNIYIQGKDSDDRLVFISPSGNIIYPSSGGSANPSLVARDISIPLGPKGNIISINVTLAMHSGRIYFAHGQLQFFMVAIDKGVDGLVQPSVANPKDPSADINYSFSEFTLTSEGVVWTNISFVDFIGLVLSLYLENTDGSSQEVVGLPINGVELICDDLAAQSRADGLPWASHCIAGSNGAPLRVVSPNGYADIDESAFADYWGEYVDQVWDRFRKEDLIIDTQSPVGDVACRVLNETLICDGDNRGYPKPTAVDIWGCNSGPFGILKGDNEVHLPVVPRLCAAFHRSTLLLKGGEYQPDISPNSYYTVDPTNHYSRIVHERQVDGRGYTFPYDDVHSDGVKNAGGLINSHNPRLLRFYVGGTA